MKNTQKLGLLAERGHRLAVDFALQSATHGSRGLAVVADEIRGLGNAMYALYDALCETNSKPDTDWQSVRRDLATLRTNALIEIFWLSGCHDIRSAQTIQCAILCDELGHLLDDFSAWLGEEPAGKPVELRPLHPSVVTDEPICCLALWANDVLYVENVRYVREIFWAAPGAEVNVRGMKLPVHPLSAKGEGLMPYAVLGFDRLSKTDGLYALGLDSIPDLFSTRLGTHTGHGKELRECWEAEGGELYRFLRY